MSLLSPSGTLAQKPFVLGALAVYFVSFLSQILLAAPIIMKTGLWPFALVQVALIWVWYVLHAKRLHDANRESGMAVGIAAIYTLMIVLLILVMALLISGDTPSNASDVSPGMVQLFAIIFFFSMLFGDAGEFWSIGIWVLCFLILILAPVFVALGFSLWTATRPSAAAKP